MHRYVVSNNVCLVLLCWWFARFYHLFFSSRTHERFARRYARDGIGTVVVIDISPLTQLIQYFGGETSVGKVNILQTRRLQYTTGKVSADRDRIGQNGIVHTGIFQGRTP
jgi:hypothetical protein